MVRPTATTVPASAGGLDEGAKATYDVLEETTVTYTSISSGVGGPGGGRRPAPTTTVMVKPWRDAVTVSANASFAGTNGLYDVRITELLTGRTPRRTARTPRSGDQYVALSPGWAGVAHLVSYGSKRSVRFTIPAAVTESVDETRTNAVALFLERWPSGQT